MDSVLMEAKLLFFRTISSFSIFGDFICYSFLLLESLYQAFDRIAQRRKVFKIETIGDCVREQHIERTICVYNVLFSASYWF